jgi:uncharacterized protein
MANDSKTKEVIEQLSAPVIDTTGIAQLKPNGWVNDFEGIFTEVEKHALDSIINGIEKETTIEIAVVTLDTSMVGEEVTDIYEATFAIAKNWGVGKKEKDNGILIGISKGRKQMYIQNGKGIEKVFTDEETAKIVDEVFIPLFAQNKFFDGTAAGIKAIMERLTKK